MACGNCFLFQWTEQSSSIELPDTTSQVCNYNITQFRSRESLIRKNVFVFLCKMDRFKQRFQSSPSCSIQSADEKQPQKETKVTTFMIKWESLWYYWKAI